MSLLKSVQASDLGLGPLGRWGHGDPMPVAAEDGWAAGCRREGVSNKLDVLWLTGYKESDLSCCAGLPRGFVSKQQEGWWLCVKKAF